MSSNQLPINATSSAVTVMPVNQNRIYILIQNYVGSTNNLYVRFGKTATVRTAGEIEIIPGGHYEMGSAQSSKALDFPTEFVSVISDGTATGGIMELSSA